MAHEYDPLIRAIADACRLDFYYVERMLKIFVQHTVDELEKEKTSRTFQLLKRLGYYDKEK